MVPSRPEPRKPRTHLAAKVREARRKTGLSQRELSQRAGVVLSCVGDIEAGRPRLPGAFTAIRLARALGTTVEDLFGDGA